MRKFGLLVAVEDEALRQILGEGFDLQDGYGTKLYQTKTCQLYAVHSGAGEVFAAAMTQHLIDRFGVSAVLNYGVVGACTDELRAGATFIVRSVVHYQYDISGVDNVMPGEYLEKPSRWMPTDEAIANRILSAFPGLRGAICASGDKFVADPAEKRRLHDEFGADICDMEAAAILLTCDRSHIPCVLIKTVSDGVDGGADEYWQEKHRTAVASLETLLEITEHI